MSNGRPRKNCLRASVYLHFSNMDALEECCDLLSKYRPFVVVGGKRVDGAEIRKDVKVNRLYDALPCEPTRIGTLHGRCGRGYSYKSFQRYIAELALQGRVRITKSVGGPGGTTTMVEKVLSMESHLCHGKVGM